MSDIQTAEIQNCIDGASGRCQFYQSAAAQAELRALTERLARADKWAKLWKSCAYAIDKKAQAVADELVVRWEEIAEKDKRIATLEQLVREHEDNFVKTVNALEQQLKSMSEECERWRKICEIDAKEHTEQIQQAEKLWYELGCVEGVRAGEHCDHCKSYEEAKAERDGGAV